MSGVIAGVLVDLLEIPFRRPIETAGGRWASRTLALVRLVDEDGLEGVGEAATEGPAGVVRGAGDALEATLPATLAGLDPGDAVAVDARLAGAQATAEAAIVGAAATAAADLAARQAGLSLAASVSDRVRDAVAVNGLIDLMAAPEAGARAAALAGQGLTCLKLKCADEPAAALAARVGAVRDAVGSAVRLRLDANGAWSDAAAAGAAIRAVEQFDIELVEQPLPVEAGPGAFAALRAKVAVPLAADESVTGLAAAEALLAAGGVDVLVVKPTRVGGFRAGRAIADRAADTGVGVIVSTLFETGVGIAAALHLAATLPDDGRAHGLATADLLSTDLLVKPLAIHAGRMPLPAGSGLGVTLDRAAVERHRARIPVP